MSRTELYQAICEFDGSEPNSNTLDPRVRKLERVRAGAISLARIEATTRAQFSALQIPEKRRKSAREIDKRGFNYSKLPELLKQRGYTISGLWERLLASAVHDELRKALKVECDPKILHVYRYILSEYSTEEKLYQHFSPSSLWHKIYEALCIVVNKYPSDLGRTPTAQETIALLQRSFFTYFAPLTTTHSNVAFAGNFRQLAATIQTVSGAHVLAIKPADIRVEQERYQNPDPNVVTAGTLECPFNTPSRLLKPFLDEDMRPAQYSGLHETFQIFMDKLEG